MGYYFRGESSYQLGMIAMGVVFECWSDTLITERHLVPWYSSGVVGDVLKYRGMYGGTEVSLLVWA